jgi:hypothetical protein
MRQLNWFLFLSFAFVLLVQAGDNPTALDGDREQWELSPSPLLRHVPPVPYYDHTHRRTKSAAIDGNRSY